MGESLSLAGWDHAALLPHNLIGSGRCEEDDVWAALWEVREPAASDPPHRGWVLQVMGSEAGRDAAGVRSADHSRAGGLAAPRRLAEGDHIHDVLAMHRDIQDRLAAQRHTAGCLAGAGHRANVLAGPGCTAGCLAGAGHTANVLEGAGCTAGRPAQHSHAGGTTGAPTAQSGATDSRAGRLAGAGHTANLLAGAGHTAS